ncbi:MAG: YggT family protein [Janibacter sp.]
MEIARQLLDLVLSIYFYILIGRLIFEWVQIFARDWRPSGPILVVAEAIYSLTDPPLKAIRRVIPPLRLGGVAIDLAFLVLILVVSILRAIV